MKVCHEGLNTITPQKLILLIIFLRVLGKKGIALVLYKCFKLGILGQQF
jgi:hypothetical protein